MPVTPGWFAVNPLLYSDIFGPHGLHTYLDTKPYALNAESCLVKSPFISFYIEDLSVAERMVPPATPNYLSYFLEHVLRDYGRAFSHKLRYVTRQAELPNELT